MDERRNLLTLRGVLIPYVRLRDIFHSSEARPALEEAVIIENGNRSFGIVVDHVIGQHQTVIKTLGPMYRHTQGLSGATIMGDGSVALIVDAAQIMRVADLQEEHQVNAAHHFQLSDNSGTSRTVLT